MVGHKVPRHSAAAEVGRLLDSPEITGLIAELDELRWTGRPGYSHRSLIGACLVKAVYAITTWTRTVALIREHKRLRKALGECPSIYAVYRFTTKLREHGDLLDDCLGRVLTSLHAELPDMGRDIAIDGSDIPAYANGQRFVSKNGPSPSRTPARWPSSTSAWSTSSTSASPAQPTTSPTPARRSWPSPPSPKSTGVRSGRRTLRSALNKEIRRRTDVVGTFPNRPSVLRLVGSVLAEHHDEWQDTRRYMSVDATRRVDADVHPVKEELMLDKAA